MSFTSLKQLQSLDFDESPEVISKEEGYALTERYVSYLYYHQEKFSYLRTQRDLEDVISECYLHFLEKRLFEKYDSSITSKKYHVMLSCKRHMIDISKKVKSAISLNTPLSSSMNDGEELTLQDVIPSKDDVEVEAFYRVTRDRILAILPETTKSKVQGKSPIRGTIKFTLREIALHLEAGFNEEQIAKMYVNPYNGNFLSRSRVHQMVLKMRELCQAYSEVI